MNIDSDILLIDKPEGWTSFDVVAKIRGKIRTDYLKQGIKPTKKQLRVGHAGTLDPFATGLLVILIGDACKRAGEFLKLDKTYEFTAKLGETSTTGDPEGEISKWQMADSKKQKEESIRHPELACSEPVESDSGSSQVNPSVANQISEPTIDEVENVLKKFIGEITQTPPAFSAIKINGQRAYKLAREGKEVNIPPRQVTITRLEVIDYSYPYLKCVCDVSSGTYIRTLVEDIGKALSTGAYCSQLRRTKVGKFDISDAVSIDKIV